MIHNALIKKYYIQIYLRPVLHIHIPNYTCTYCTYTISINYHSHTAFTSREVLLLEVTLYRKSQNYHFNTILELILILVINGLTYQGRDILLSVRYICNMVIVKDSSFPWQSGEQVSGHTNNFRREYPKPSIQN